MEIKEFLSHEIPVTQVYAQTEQDSKALGRPLGLYSTIKTGPLDRLVDYEKVCACLVDQLRQLLAPYFGKTLLVCGIGNQAVPHDALGPEAARRIRPEAYKAFSARSDFEQIAVICPGVKALTNLSSETTVASIAAAIDAACILTIDACACKEVERLCSTIQLSSSGMQTYWGTANLSESTLGIPVVSIAVPTAIRMADLSTKKNVDPEQFLTPVNIVNAINAAAFVIACAITQMVYPELDFESCKQYISFFLYDVV